MTSISEPVGANLVFARSFYAHPSSGMALWKDKKGEHKVRPYMMPVFMGMGLLTLSAAHAAPVAVTPADAPVIKRAIAAQKGHVVLVNFWATWCGPCVAEFPAIVQTSRRYKSQGLRVFAVSADQAKDTQTKVVPFLQKAGADFPAYVEKSADPEEFIDAFDPAWQGDLPRTIIFDKLGRRVKTLTGEQTVQSLAAAVRPYLQPSRPYLQPSRPARRYARK